MWLGQAYYGTNLAPNFIRATNIINVLKLFNDDVEDIGNISVYNKHQYNNVSIIASIIRDLATIVAKILAKRFPLILGGDHSIAIGTLAGAGMYFNNLGIIWFDAHADINTPITSPTGNVHGMPLAVSMGYGHPESTIIGKSFSKVKPRNIIYIRLREIDIEEEKLIRGS